MIEWKNINTFKRHMEDMESFRRAHSHLAPRELLRQAQEIPAPQNNAAPAPADSPNFFTDENGKIIVVPIWGIDMPKSSQN